MFGGFAAGEFPEGSRMSNDSPEKRQAFQRWLSALRVEAGVSPVADGEESGVISLDDQATLVRLLPKDVVRLLREREAGRHLAVDPDSTAIFHPPPDLIARARRLVPPKKPERSVPPSTPAESLSQAHPTPVVAAPLPEEAVVLPELHQPPLPILADAVESEAPPPATPSLRAPASAPPAALAPQPRRAARFAWTVTVLGSALLAVSAWFVLTR
jgi:hypothetical protein